MPPSRFAPWIGLALILGAPPSGGQTAGTSPCAEPAATGPGCGAAGALATIDGKALTLQDLPPKEREAVLGLDAEIARSRREALEEAINDQLLEIEARQGRVTPDQFYFTMIVRRVAPVTEEEIRAEYEARPDIHASATLDDAREWLMGTLREKHQTELFERWAAAARARHPVVYGAAVDGSRLSPSAVLARVAGRRITVAALEVPWKVKRQGLEQQVYARERKAVEVAVRARLLEAEALRRGSRPEDVLRAEVDDRVRPASDEDVASYFEQHRGDFDGDLASSRAGIAEFLNSDARDEAERLFYSRLREGVDVQIALREPVPIRLEVATKGAPARGRPTARVTIVEFGDFECRPCGRMYRELGEVLGAYGDPVRLVFRQFPMSMHPHAFRAAEASMAAHAQGRFWEYADRLFRNQNALDEASLRRYAAQSGLDPGGFDRAMRADALGARVVHDIREARSYGVKWTPTLFVNGVQVRGPLREAIDAALAEATKAARSGP